LLSHGPWIAGQKTNGLSSIRSFLYNGDRGIALDNHDSESSASLICLGFAWHLGSIVDDKIPSFEVVGLRAEAIVITVAVLVSRHASSFIVSHTSY
jgi:hypothetical protein